MTVYGGLGNDHLYPFGGQDRVVAGAGNDYTGAPNSDGPDMVRCGSGRDVVAYNVRQDRMDTLVNCEVILTLD